ncbi:hypothetical protein DIURU_003345 [Diutina rugosa]|uniref:Uncharacterized protein n=1 Tax=Diutina rugosa TaxID=5481 RepID=A0A642UPY9_DIURU|nr:uncharacterized protein DIURU_003345 [Diutina rugosa]KAA8900975.1 hypothetical protein DIURU_003345 [Diutina rugosa]
MAVTRSKKITFDEDGNSPDVAIVETKTVHEVESESDSDDEAPEEESVNTAKKQVMSKEQEQRQAASELKRKEKEKRKAIDLRNQEQKQLKRDVAPVKEDEEELPELLDDDILNAFNDESDEDEPSSVQNTHIRLDEVSEEELQRQAKLAKLEALKQSRGATIKRGPVYVAVNHRSRHKLAPKRDAVMASKDQWLNRKALNKK